MKKQMMCAVCEGDAFMVSGTDKKELVEVLKMHARHKHHIKESDADAAKMIQEC